MANNIAHNTNVFLKVKNPRDSLTVHGFIDRSVTVHDPEGWTRSTKVGLMKNLNQVPKVK